MSRDARRPVPPRPDRAVSVLAPSSSSALADSVRHDARAAGSVVTIGRTTALDDLPEFLTASETASFLAIGRGSVYELIRRGELPVVRLGRLVRVPKSGLTALAVSDGRSDVN